MKHLLSSTLISALILSTFSFNAASASVPESRYQFSDLQQLDSFPHWNVHGWHVIDSRSLIVESSPGRSYLLILDRDLPALRFSEGIAISSVNSQVNAQFDRVTAQDRFSRPTTIAEIYLIPDRATRQNVRARILAE